MSVARCAHVVVGMAGKMASSGYLVKPLYVGKVSADSSARDSVDAPKSMGTCAVRFVSVVFLCVRGDPKT